MGGLLPYIPVETERRIIHTLTYVLHGGSGLNWTPADVYDADIGHIMWQLEYLQEQRKEESRQLEKASRGK